MAQINQEKSCKGDMSHRKPERKTFKDSLGESEYERAGKRGNPVHSFFFWGRSMGRTSSIPPKENKLRSYQQGGILRKGGIRKSHGEGVYFPYLQVKVEKRGRPPLTSLGKKKTFK